MRRWGFDFEGSEFKRGANLGAAEPFPKRCQDGVCLRRGARRGPLRGAGPAAGHPRSWRRDGAWASPDPRRQRRERPSLVYRVKPSQIVNIFPAARIFS